MEAEEVAAAAVVVVVAVIIVGVSLPEPHVTPPAALALFRDARNSDWSRDLLFSRPRRFQANLPREELL